MDAATENQAFRASKMSRLPAPSSTQIGGGLTEWSDSQHNARVQPSVPAPIALKSLKREIPQPATPLTAIAHRPSASQSDAKRKPLSDRALEYPAKPSLAAASSTTRSTIKGQSLSGISGPPASASASTSADAGSSTFDAWFALVLLDRPRPGSRLRRIGSASALLKPNPWNGDIRPLFSKLHDFRLSFGLQRRDDEHNFRFILGTRHASIPDTIDENDEQLFLKQPTSFQSRQIPTSATTNGLAKSIGPNRQLTSDRPQTRQNVRPNHARSKSQAPRPRTAHGLRDRDDDRLDLSQHSNGTTNSTSDSLHVRKTRARRSNSAASTIRDISLTSRFNQLSLEDRGTALGGTQAISQLKSRQFPQPSVTSQQPNITIKRPAKDKSNGKPAATARKAASEET
ncbi:hypothetical protein B0T10DRAFT_459471 [Thelonectria olida]|uniref:Uncharacterized protein n=1 Tax=Thelonectria olida TaxID=1576542 RepID=A0A9P8W5D0_9HYPO|nr:hypothetical protein B0T10DRAFT_459471 [Thelonectria olida]